MSRTRLAVAVAVAVLWSAAGPRAFEAPTPLQAALDLYAAAAYDEALAALDAVSGAGLSSDDRVVVAQHRMLCLMAMGRTAAAERAAADLLTLRPSYVLGAHEASPRVRAMFDDTRKRVLPGVVRELFTAARRLYDAGEVDDARAAFSSVAQALADEAVVAGNATLADLRTLADGFLVLSAAASPRPATDGAVAAPDALRDSAAPPVAPAPAQAAIEPLPTDAERAAGAALAAPASPPASAPVRIVDDSASLVSFPTDPAVSWRQGEGDVEPPHDDARAGEDAPVAHDSAPDPTRLHEPIAEVPAVASATPSATAPLAPESASASAPVTSAADVVAAPAIAPAAFEGSMAPSAPHPASAVGAPFAPIDIFTYDWRDKDVAPPAPVAQAVSGWWGSMGEPPAGTPLGAVEVVVDEHGAVASARIYQSVNRIYDGVLLESVKQWRYRPATRGGRPVKYRRITGVVSGR